MDDKHNTPPQSDTNSPSEGKHSGLVRRDNVVFLHPDYVPEDPKRPEAGPFRRATQWIGRFAAAGLNRRDRQPLSPEEVEAIRAEIAEINQHIAAREAEQRSIVADTDPARLTLPQVKDYHDSIDMRLQQLKAKRAALQRTLDLGGL